jgi:hypothetical protein
VRRRHFVRDRRAATSRSNGVPATNKFDLGVLR